jgi:hypothetical protein
VCAVSSDSSRRKYLSVRMRWPLYMQHGTCPRHSRLDIVR